MNKYKNLAFNTIVFTIGSFGSKLLSLLLNNLYTKHISPTQLYTKTLVETLALFLIPVFTFSLGEAVIRYGLDNRYDKTKIFTTTSLLSIAGLLLMTLFVPLMHFIPFFSSLDSYTLLLIVYILASSFRAQCSQFVRAREMVKLFSLDGIFTTLMLLIFNIIFISYLGLGVKGFMISTILSDLCSAVFLFLSAGLKEYLNINAFSFSLGKVMLRFCIPLIPTTVMWTFTGFSDQLFIGGMKGECDAGIYSAAAKIPNLISMLSTIFFQAWNMSAITENKSKDRDVFYEKVYGAYEAVLFIGSAFLILLIKPVSALMINHSVFPEYSKAYIYTPLLIAAALFTCLDLFLASIYTATKHTVNAFVTIFAAFILNIILNTVLIPAMGIQGAALATFLSYFLCFVIRIADARRFVPFRYNPYLSFAGTSLILLMCFFTITRPDYHIISEIVLTVLVTVIFIVRLISLSSNHKHSLKYRQK